MKSQTVDYMMSAAVVKGLVEHGDATKFFGSLLSFTHHLTTAVQQGLVVMIPTTKRGHKIVERRVTPRGLEWYTRCLKDLPQCRQVFWDRAQIGAPNLEIK